MTSLGISVEHHHLWRISPPKLMITENNLKQIQGKLRVNTNLNFLCLKRVIIRI